MTTKDPNSPTDLSPAGATDYAARLQAAQQGNAPLGGAPMPTIPRLDQAPPGTGDRSQGVQQAGAQNAQAQEEQRRAGIANAMSPEQHAAAVAAGQIIPGVGSGYVQNQPKGVQISPAEQPQGPAMEKTGPDGQPANPIRPEGGLSKETVEGLAAMTAANAEPDKPEEGKPEKGKEEIDFDEFDFEEFGRASRDMLNNKERRNAIEAKITDELDFEGLIINQELRQKVPIRKGFEPQYRTPGGHEDLFVKRLIGNVEGSERYILDYYAIMGLCTSLYALNGRPLPSHLDNNGDPDEKLFEEKMKFLLKYPIVIVTDLSVNFSWFTGRVQKLLNLDQVKDF